MKQIAEHFKQMGNAIVINLLFAVIIWFSISRNLDNLKLIDTIINIGAVGELIFVIWYIRWWYRLSDKFRSIDFSEEKKVYDWNLPEPSNNEKNSVLIIIITIILFCLLIFLFGL